jgi:putative oxidoreductase
MPDAIAVIGRVLLSAIFIWAGLGKIGSPSDTIQYITSFGLPAAPAAYLVAVLIEVGGGLALLLGWQARAAGVTLAIFAVATAVVFHTHFTDPVMVIQFMKNLAIAGGMLQVAAYGAGAMSVDAVLSGRRNLSISGRPA